MVGGQEDVGVREGYGGQELEEHCQLFVCWCWARSWARSEEEARRPLGDHSRPVGETGSVWTVSARICLGAVL